MSLNEAQVDVGALEGWDRKDNEGRGGETRLEKANEPWILNHLVPVSSPSSTLSNTQSTLSRQEARGVGSNWLHGFRREFDLSADNWNLGISKGRNEVASPSTIHQRVL